MKKNLFTKLAVGVSALLILSVGPSFATDNCNGPTCQGTGDMNAISKGAAGQISFDYEIGRSAGTFGASASGGLARSQGAGFVDDGEGYIDTGIVAGGIGNAQSYKFYGAGYDDGNREVFYGVGSVANAEARTAANLNMNAWALNKWKEKRGWFGRTYYEPDAGFAAGGDIVGLAGQGTLVGSGLTTTPRFMDTEGATGAISGQASIGGFRGGAFIAGGPGASAGAGVNVDIDMVGASDTQSGRDVEYGRGYTREGLWSEAGSMTMVNSTYGRGYGSNSWLAPAYAGAEGGFIAGGIAATKTVQGAPGAAVMSGAKASYTGSGDLNCNYYGVAGVYSETNIITVHGNNGRIVSAQSGAHVASQASRNYVD